MNTAPTVLDVPGKFFRTTPKYLSSAAMVLDDSASCDESTGDVESPSNHVMVYWEIDVAQAYSIVSEYVEMQDDSPSWWEVKQMIDILSSGRNWLVRTDSQGFVSAQCEPNDQEARKIWEAIEHIYNNWLGDDE